MDPTQQQQQPLVYNAANNPAVLLYVRENDTLLQRYFLSHLFRASASLRQLSCKQAFVVIFAVALVVFGNIGQLLALNMWLFSFGAFGGPFTVLTLSATTTAVFYGILLFGWVLVRRQSLWFLFNRQSIPLILGVGLCNATNGVALVYATGHTPEVLQALLLSTQLIWIFLFVKIAFREKRSYFSPLVVLSFFFSLGGITLGMVSQFSQGSGYTQKRIEWSLIFAAGMIPGALYNVIAAKFLRKYTTPETPQPVAEPSNPVYPDVEVNKIAAEPLVQPAPVPLASGAADGFTVKLALLFTTGVAQAALMFAFLPLDAAPWFGSPPYTISSTVQNLKAGYQCVFTNNFAPLCQDCFWYYVAFNISYMLNYLGTTWLNLYSPALTSIMTQLSSPLAAIALIAFPALNTFNTPYNLGESIGGVILLTIGSIVYSAWEESTKQQEKNLQQMYLSTQVQYQSAYGTQQPL